MRWMWRFCPRVQRRLHGPLGSDGGCPEPGRAKSEWRVRSILRPHFPPRPQGHPKRVHQPLQLQSPCSGLQQSPQSKFSPVFQFFYSFFFLIGLVIPVVCWYWPFLLSALLFILHISLHQIKGCFSGCVAKENACSSHIQHQHPLFVWESWQGQLEEQKYNGLNYKKKVQLLLYQMSPLCFGIQCVPG